MTNFENDFFLDFLLFWEQNIELVFSTIGPFFYNDFLMNPMEANILLMNNITTQACTINPLQFSTNKNTSDVTSSKSLVITNNDKFKSETNLKDMIRSEIKLRNLCPGDVPELKQLCTEWFPVE